MADGRRSSGLGAGALALMLPLWFVAGCEESRTPPETTKQSIENGLQGRRLKSRPGPAPYANFESGNIGRVVRRSKTSYDLYLRDDRGGDFPPFWRQWWYLKLTNVPVGPPVTFTLKGRGHWNRYVPAYSYDNTLWGQFDDRRVSQPKRHELRWTARFKKSTVWMARYWPYTYTKLRSYLKRIRPGTDVRLSSIGRTPEGRLIPFVAITDPNVSASKKKRVMIHARTHPGEVGSSFIIEGLMNYLTSNVPYAGLLKKHLIFDLIPMLNVDGVVVGNNRVSPEGVNLEGKWNMRDDNPYLLRASDTPHEIKLFHRKIQELVRQGPRMTVAINIHASNGQPEDRPFFFPHFGPRRLGYGPEEAKLWSKQQRFIRLYKQVQGAEWFNPVRINGGRSFIAKTVPESFWWKNSKGAVMALSVEATYGRTPDGRQWIRPTHLRSLGASMAKALGLYHGIAPRDRAH